MSWRAIPDFQPWAAWRRNRGLGAWREAALMMRSLIVKVMASLRDAGLALVLARHIKKIPEARAPGPQMRS